MNTTHTKYYIDDSPITPEPESNKTNEELTTPVIITQPIIYQQPLGEDAFINGCIVGTALGVCCVIS